jgi:Putative threonine efflux protein
MIFKGFKFGMLLQLAIGPVCLFIFTVGGNKGFINAEVGVLGVTSTDALYILFAICGIASFIDREKVKKIFEVAGAVIVALYGLQMILGVFGLKVIPNVYLFEGIRTESTFLEGLVITAANPLTILFWVGVFSSKIAEEKLLRKDVYLFGLGSVLSTLFFLTVVAILASFTGYFLPHKLISILNSVVGVALIYFALRMIIKRN